MLPRQTDLPSTMPRKWDRPYLNMLQRTESWQRNIHNLIVNVCVCTSIVSSTVPATKLSLPFLSQVKGDCFEAFLISWPPIALLPSPSISDRAKDKKGTNTHFLFVNDHLVNKFIQRHWSCRFSGPGATLGYWGYKNLNIYNYWRIFTPSDFNCHFEVCSWKNMLMCTQSTWLRRSISNIFICKSLWLKAFANWLNVNIYLKYNNWLCVC